MIDVMAFCFLSHSDFPWNAQDQTSLLIREFVAIHLIVSATNAIMKEMDDLYF